jgi:MFS family permease
MFLGAVMGGYLSHKMGYSAVFVFCALLMGVWLLLAFGMITPPSVKTKMYHVGDLTALQYQQLEQSVKNLAGVVDATLIAQEHNLIVKINNQQSKAQQAEVELAITNLIGSA